MANKNKAKVNGTDIVDECPRGDRDKPTVTECIDHFIETAMKEEKCSQCWKCVVGRKAREQYSGITQEEQREDMEDIGGKMDISEDITASTVKTRNHTLFQKSSG